MDRYVPPFLGRRRGWLVLTQLALAAGIAAMAVRRPEARISWLLGAARSSSALRLRRRRTSSSTPTAPTWLRPERAAWRRVHRASATASRCSPRARLALVLVADSGSSALGGRTVPRHGGADGRGLGATLAGPEPDRRAQRRRSRSTTAMRAPLREFFSRPGAWLLLALIVLYKLGDAFAGSSPPLSSCVGPASRCTMWATRTSGWASGPIVGALAGGALMMRLGLPRAHALRHPAGGHQPRLHVLAVGQELPAMIAAVGPRI